METAPNQDPTLNLIQQQDVLIIQRRRGETEYSLRSWLNTHPKDSTETRLRRLELSRLLLFREKPSEKKS